MSVELKTCPNYPKLLNILHSFRYLGLLRGVHWPVQRLISLYSSPNCPVFSRNALIRADRMLAPHDVAIEKPKALIEER